MDESSTPTALVKIFGDFDSRVRTASRRTFSTTEKLGRHPSGQTSSTFQLRASRASESSLLRGKLAFDESNVVFPSPVSQGLNSSKKRGALDELDFGNYPKAKRIDDNRGLSLEIERLKTQLMEKDVEIVSKDADIKKEQALVKKMQFEVAKHKLEQEREHEEQVRLLRKERERNVNLEHQLMRMKRYQANEEEYQELRAHPIQQSPDESFPSEVEKLLEENVRLRDDLYEEKQRASENESEMKDEISSLRSKNEELEEQLNSIKFDAETDENASRRIDIEEMKGKLEVAQQENKQLESTLQAVEEDRIQQRLMKDKLNSYAKLERELAKVKDENQLLKDTADNAKLLKEQNEDLLEKLKRAENGLQESRLKQETYFYAKRQLDQWRHVVYKLCTPSERESLGKEVGPDILNGKISTLQQDIVTKTENIASLEQSLTQKRKDLKNIEDQMEMLNKKSITDKQNLTEQANLIKRFKRKLLLVSKERDSYKGVLESYEHELTFNGATFEKDRVTALEESLKEYRETVERLEELLGAARSSATHKEVEAQLREEISDLKAKLQTTQNQGVESESRVLHFLNNPLQQATDERRNEVEQLNAEITALRARVKLLEEGETSNLTLLVGRKMDEGFTSEEVMKLQNEIESAKKKHDRLIEAFTKKGQDFRTAVCQLTGFQFDGLADDTMYRVKPVAYTDAGDDDHLLFKSSETGDFGLVPTRFTNQHHVQKMIDLHFHQQASIPMLLAAIMSDCFERYPTESSNFEQTEYQGEDREEESDARTDDEGNDDDDDGEDEAEVEEEEEFEEEQEIQEEEEDEGDNDSSSDIVCLE